ncbi:hypothetical protein ACFL0H_04500, partial [Thermodesulfobacteriota bacterium]
MNNRNHYLIALKKWIEEGAGQIYVSGLSGAARAYFLAELLVEIERPCLIVLPKAREANRL